MQTRSIVSIFAFASILGLGRAASAGSTLARSSAPATSTVRVVVDSQGFAPASIEVKKGQPVTLESVRTTDGTCAKEVVVPTLNVRKPLPLNTPVDIPIPADRTTTYAFACGMGMFKGSVVVR
jgi:plastocyanin domain-containing protein